jgi:hypothetical protein
MDTYLYATFVAPVTQMLYGEALVLGSIFVGFGYFPAVMRAPSRRIPSFVLKRMFLLFAVSMLAMYAVVTYNFDGLPYNAIPDDIVAGLSNVDIWTKVSFVTLIVIDLFLVFVIGLMFVSLAVPAVGQEGLNELERGVADAGYMGVGSLLKIQFFGAASWHLGVIVWWYLNAFANSKGQVLVPENIGSFLFHGRFALIHIAAGVTWTLASRLKGARALEWVWVAIFVVTVSTTFTERLFQYLDWTIDYLEERCYCPTCPDDECAPPANGSSLLIPD